MNPLEPATAYQQSAVVAAACASGVVDAVSGEPRQPAAVAAVCGTDRAPPRALLGAMAALGLADHGPAGYRLSEDGAVLAGSRESVALIVAKEWFFYRAWAGLPGERRRQPRIHSLARAPRRRPGRSLDFLRALDDLAARFGGELPALAGLAGPGRLLDAGGGAGSTPPPWPRPSPAWRPPCSTCPRSSRFADRHPELAFVPGDLDRPRFRPPARQALGRRPAGQRAPRPPGGRCRAFVALLPGLLAPGGTLLVYEWVLDEGGDTPPAVALFDLMMLVENEGGAAWTASGSPPGWRRPA